MLKIFRFILSRTFFFVAGLLCFIGIITVFASWPNAPFAESGGGWLGSIFNLNESGTGKLIIKSEKMGIGTTSIEPNLTLKVSGKVGANTYCDANGNNCTMASNLGVVDSNANTICSGTDKYLDGNGNCDSATTIVAQGGGSSLSCITKEKMNTDTASVYCNSDYKMMSGICLPYSSDFIEARYEGNNGWTCYDPGHHHHEIKAYIRCCK